MKSELALVRPEALVLLGATAATALAGDDVRVTRDHGRRIERPPARFVTVTTHPSAVLRARDRPSWEAALEGLVADLAIAAAALG